MWLYAAALYFYKISKGFERRHIGFFFRGVKRESAQVGLLKTAWLYAGAAVLHFCKNSAELESAQANISESTWLFEQADVLYL